MTERKQTVTTVVEDHGGFKELRYDGRTVKLVIMVNTTEDANQLCHRVCDFIKESDPNPMVVGNGIIEKKEVSDAVWKAILNLVGGSSG